MSPAKKKLAFIINSGRFERVAFALDVAAAAAATGNDVNILFGHSGVVRLKEGKTDDVDYETDNLVAKRIKVGFEKGSLTPISELLETIKKFGARIYACPQAMELHNIVVGELIKEVDEVRSVVRFVAEDIPGANVIYV